MLSLRAETDLIEVWGYSFSQWGKKQANSYIDELYERFAWLAENPLLGKHRPDIHLGYYTFRQGSHLIFYIIADRGVEIIGIPHKGMDVVSYFE